MRIAIVEDVPADWEFLLHSLKVWALENRIPLIPVPDLFTSGEALLSKFQKDQYDIIFLDVYLDGITGMETAQKIREKDGSCHLIFTTAFAGFAVDSYEVNSTYYLVKPFSPQKLSQAMERCKALCLEREQSISIPGQDGEQRLYLHRIAYTEYEARRVRVHYQDGKGFSVPMNHRDFAALLLPYPYFCDCMKGILVNFEAVDKLMEDHFRLRDGSSIPISRLKYKEVREHFLNYTYAHARGEL